MSSPAAHRLSGPTTRRLANSTRRRYGLIALTRLLALRRSALLHAIATLAHTEEHRAALDARADRAEGLAVGQVLGARADDGAWAHPSDRAPVQTAVRRPLVSGPAFPLSPRRCASPITALASRRIDAITQSRANVPPMTVLTIASSKGGPGKTTVCMLLAGRLARDGLRVAALDADPQPTPTKGLHS